MATEAKLFEFVAHTADVAVLIHGRNIPDLFRHAAAALYALTTTGPDFAAVQCRTISIDSVDRDALLVDWLNELVYLLYVEHAGFSDFRFDELADGHLTSRCCGEYLVPGVHRLHLEVKAATHHMVHIARTRGGYTARIVLDV